MKFREKIIIKGRTGAGETGIRKMDLKNFLIAYGLSTNRKAIYY